MKRIRLMSIADHAALDRLMHRAAWGQPFWRNLNQRKQREYNARQSRGLVLQLIAQHQAAQEAMPLPGEIKSAALH